MLFLLKVLFFMKLLLIVQESIHFVDYLLFYQLFSVDKVYLVFCVEKH